MTEGEDRVPFNVNHCVRVRLTDAGRAVLRKEHDDLFSDWPADRKPEYSPPEADSEGWSRFQLWDLMHRIGRACYMGGPVPFETSILVETTAPPKEAEPWRPIETAPKDGTCFLLGYDDETAAKARLEPHQRVYEGRWDERQNTFSARNGFLLHSDSTHWMPLPPAPNQPETGA